jgi:lactate dehydrogenase-like 2-hydroxyacid dehydrogenase
MDILKKCSLISEIKVNPHDRVLTRQELEEGVKWCDALMCQLTDTIDDSLLALNPKLKIAANFAVGYNNIDVKAATARGVPITNTPGVLTETTADLTFALLLAMSRRIVESDKYMRAGKYKSWAPMLLLGSDVHSKTIGIVGFGRIGYSVAQRARGFNMKVLYNDIEEKSYAKEFDAKLVSLETLLKESDFVTLHPFLDNASNHLIGEAQLKMMKPTSFLINASRGPVVDEKALVKALKAKVIAGAALDVYEREPEFEPELAQLDNVVMVPHIGSATIETRNAMGSLAANNIVARLKGEKLLSCVNPEVLQKN